LKKKKIKMNISIKKTVKKYLRSTFEYCQYLGFDLLPRHFYSEIPSIKELKSTNSWRKPYSMMGVRGSDLEKQLSFVRRCLPKDVVEEISSRNIYNEAMKKSNEQGYGKVESDFLFGFVATEKPKTIFQIGCGVSTAVCLSAADFAGYKPSVICVEPYPSKFLKSAEKNRKIKLIEKKAQNLDMETIEKLRTDTFFFVDSTHTLGPSGEVTWIILEMLPRLGKGNRIHFHDIYFPYDYRRSILDSDLFFGTRVLSLWDFSRITKGFEY